MSERKSADGSFEDEAGSSVEAARREQVALREVIPRSFDAFFDRFPRLLPIQRGAIRPLADGLDVLLAAPTAGGKTEACVAPMLQRLLDAGGRGFEGPGLLYIVPTRALVNDVYRRLTVPCQRLGVTLGRKTADHGSLGKVIPQILVTTPESLDSRLCRAPRRLLPIRAVIVDELHALDGKPRGDQLAALLTRLRKVLATRQSGFQMALLSATVDRPESMAHRYGEKVLIIEDASRRRMAARIASSRFGVSPARRLVHLVEGKGGKVLVFCNSRADVEWATNQMRGILPFGEKVFAHHGSLAKEVRERVERDFSHARTALCFATSTLELGIDIGDVDYAVLYGMPPDLPSLLQRVGRAGRRSERLSFLALARDPGEVTRFRHALHAIRGGHLLTDPPVYDPSTALQQAASLLFQNPSHEISAMHILDRLPQWQQRWWEEERLTASLASARTWFEEFAPGRFRPTEALERSYEIGTLHGNISSEPEVEVLEELTGRRLGTVAQSQQGMGDDNLMLGGSSRSLGRRADGRLVASVGGEEAGEARFSSRPAPPVPKALASDLLRWLDLDPERIHRVETESRTVFLHGQGTLIGALLHASADSLASRKPGRGVAFGLVLKKGFQDWPAQIVQTERLRIVARSMRQKLKRLLGFGPFFSSLSDDEQERTVLEALDPAAVAHRFQQAEIEEVYEDDLRQKIRELLEP